MRPPVRSYLPNVSKAKLIADFDPRADSASCLFRWALVLLKLFRNSANCRFKSAISLFQVRDFIFQLATFAIRELWIAFTLSGCTARRFPHFHISRKQMRITRFLRSRLPRQQGHQRRLALHQMLQRGVHHAQIFERMHALCAAAQLAWRLRSRATATHRELLSPAA